MTSGRSMGGPGLHGQVHESSWKLRLALSVAFVVVGWFLTALMGYLNFLAWQPNEPGVATAHDMVFRRYATHVGEGWTATPVTALFPFLFLATSAALPWVARPLRLAALVLGCGGGWVGVCAHQL